MIIAEERPCVPSSNAECAQPSALWQRGTCLCTSRLWVTITKTKCSLILTGDDTSAWKNRLKTTSIVLYSKNRTNRPETVPSAFKSSHLMQVLLVGEFHDDPHAHAVESQLFSMLLTANGYPETEKHTSHSPPVRHASSNNYLHGMGAPDVMMGLSGAPNLWTALHDGDPALQACTLIFMHA